MTFGYFIYDVESKHKQLGMKCFTFRHKLEMLVFPFEGSNNVLFGELKLTSQKLHVIVHINNIGNGILLF